MMEEMKKTAGAVVGLLSFLFSLPLWVIIPLLLILFGAGIYLVVLLTPFIVAISIFIMTYFLMNKVAKIEENKSLIISLLFSTIALIPQYLLGSVLMNYTVSAFFLDEITTTLNAILKIIILIPVIIVLLVIFMFLSFASKLGKAGAFFATVFSGTLAFIIVFNIKKFLPFVSVGTLTTGVETVPINVAPVLFFFILFGLMFMGWYMYEKRKAY